LAIASLAALKRTMVNKKGGLQALLEVIRGSVADQPIPWN
jgi:hypothetical protein